MTDSVMSETLGRYKLTQRMVSDTETRGPDWQCPPLSLHRSSSGFSQPLFWSPAVS